MGCDGGRSTVRKSAGFAFPGTGATMTGRVASAELADESMLKSVLRGPNGLVNWGRSPLSSSVSPGRRTVMRP
ncbi:FAD-dependent monooxygenase [Streptomyces acidicola]|uniref:FAD-dependent monooxygenase n=1 Tax=Streptomyces acidicola TaxID=2596892 RepID=UPI00341774C6